VSDDRHLDCPAPATAPAPLRDPVLQGMLTEMAGAPTIYRPSKFWAHLNERNLSQLCRAGLANFKRTVNQNYFNWLPSGFEDNQLRNLIRFWAEHPSVLPLRVEIGDVDGLEGFFQSNPLLDADQRDLYRLFVGLLWHCALCTDRHGVLDRLSEPALGNPLELTLQGKRISQDLANSVRERNVLFDALQKIGRPGRPIVAAELGAGYGRLAYVFAVTCTGRYFVFDIPPALYVAQWYLSTLLGDKRVFAFRHFDRFEQVRDELAACDLGFLTPNQLELFPEGYFNAFITISSLHEMTLPQIEHYKKLMTKVTRGLVYLKQWTRSHNALDGLDIDKKAYRLDRCWKVLLDRPDGVQDLFFEMILCNET
jgi:putative sugar O-methyltransferase